MLFIFDLYRILLIANDEVNDQYLLNCSFYNSS